MFSKIGHQRLVAYVPRGRVPCCKTRLIRRIKLRQRILNANKDCPRSNPKFGFRALHAATTCGSSGGKGLVACSRCGVPTIIGWTQSTAIPTPILAPLGTKPARAHVALIWAQGFQGTG